MLNESAALGRYGCPTVQIKIWFRLDTVPLPIGNCQVTPFFCAVIVGGCGETQHLSGRHDELKNTRTDNKIRVIFFIKEKG